MINYQCEVLTPMFLKGANRNYPELRAASLKGMLRYWWRAINGHLSLNDLRTQESLIFGSAGEEGRSAVRLRMVPLVINREEVKLLPHKEFSFRRLSIFDNSTFKIKAALRTNINVENSIIFNEEKLNGLILLVSALSGLGQRNRRGYGSFMIRDEEGKLLTPNSLEEIYEKLSLFNANFNLSNSKITSNFNNTSYAYPYIRRIEIGKPSNSPDLIRRVSQLTSDLNSEFGRAYENSMGGVKSGRFASPMIFSVISAPDGQNVLPVITQMHTALPREKRGAKLLIQDEFLNRVMNG